LHGEVRQERPALPEIPRDDSLDATLAMARDPYGFIARRCRRLGTDLFQARILLRTTICMTGPDAARLFYDPRRFVRQGAPPGRIQKTLFGRGGVQELDGEAHRRRKGMFMGLVTPESVGRLIRMTSDGWSAYARKWTSMERVVLDDEAREILTRAVCAWAGVPLDEDDFGRRTRQITSLFRNAGSIGPRRWRARWERRSAEAWIEGVVAAIRAGRLRPREDSAAHVIATHRDLDGAPLAPRVAAVELLNVLRPTVATSVYVVFAAHALHRHPECRAKLQAGGSRYAHAFVQEVRRFYPFFPAVTAVVREDFEWNGHRFPAGARAMLDLYGTCHDRRVWEAPGDFRPERFLSREAGAFDLVPQGGGDPHLHHRCAGESLTVELVKLALGVLAARIRYDVPEQDLRIDRTRLPALPRRALRVEQHP